MYNEVKQPNASIKNGSRGRLPRNCSSSSFTARGGYPPAKAITSGQADGYQQQQHCSSSSSSSNLLGIRSLTPGTRGSAPFSRQSRASHLDWRDCNLPPRALRLAQTSVHMAGRRAAKRREARRSEGRPSPHRRPSVASLRMAPRPPAAPRGIASRLLVTAPVRRQTATTRLPRRAAPLRGHPRPCSAMSYASAAPTA